jgi:hypothetical protein
MMKTAGSAIDTTKKVHHVRRYIDLVLIGMPSRTAKARCARQKACAIYFPAHRYSRRLNRPSLRATSDRTFFRHAVSAKEMSGKLKRMKHVTARERVRSLARSPGLDV